MKKGFFFIMGICICLMGFANLDKPKVKEELNEGAKALEIIRQGTVSTPNEEIDNKLMNVLINAEEKIKFNINESGEEFFDKTVQKIEKIVKEHPEMFYYEGVKCEWIGNKFTLMIQYSYSQDVIREMNITLAKQMDKIIKENITLSMSDFEKEKAIHDYIVLNTIYDYENYNKGTLPKEAYTAYGVIVNKTGVCQGYAEAMKILLDKVGIKTTVVSGKLKTSIGHAWNIVEIDNKDYHVDATHDDPVPDVEGRVQYTYFNLTDEQMSETRIWDREKHPQCINDEQNYYKVMGKFITSKEEFDKKILEVVQRKDAEITIAFDKDKIKIKLNDISESLRKAGYKRRTFTYAITGEQVMLCDLVY